MSIGILLLATNRYRVFVEPLVESIAKYFIPEHEKHIFLFTDEPNDFVHLGSGVTLVLRQHEPWPNITLKRFHTFTKHKALLETQSHLCYIDVDMLFVDYVNDKILPSHSLTMTLHPGFYKKPRWAFSYESRPQSQAYIPPNRGTQYYAGGFAIGTSQAYLAYAEKCKAMIDIDLASNIHAVHDDESYTQRYCIDTAPEKVLSPAFCFPAHLCGTDGVSADYNLQGIKPVLLALDKAKEFSHD